MSGFGRLFNDYFGPNSHLHNEIDVQGNSNFFISNLVGVNCNDLVATAKKHVILTPALLFVSRMFAQAKFKLYEDSDCTKEVEDHPVLDILNNPNSLQTKSDFLEAHMFMKIASGLSCMQKLYVSGNILAGIRVLDTSLITFPENYNQNIWISKKGTSKIKYGHGDDAEFIKLADLLLSYDMPVGFNGKNSIKPVSRLEGQKQTLINSTDTNLAKNIIIKTNGKELVTAKTGTSKFPFLGDEVDDVKRNFNSKYGLGVGRSRAVITKASIEHKSLHIPLRDLGLDESLKSDCDLIMLCLNIPRDILGLTNKKSTYNNVGESYIGYIQSEMQSSADDLGDTIRIGFSENYPELEGYTIRGSYQHLSFMSSSNKKKYETLAEQASALQGFLDAGLKWEDALDKVGLDSSLKQVLKTVAQTTNT